MHTCLVTVYHKSNGTEFKITTDRWPFSMHFIRTASHNTTCLVSVGELSYHVYCAVFDVVTLVQLA